MYFCGMGTFITNATTLHWLSSIDFGSIGRREGVGLGRGGVRPGQRELASFWGPPYCGLLACQPWYCVVCDQGGYWLSTWRPASVAFRAYCVSSKWAPKWPQWQRPHWLFKVHLGGRPYVALIPPISTLTSWSGLAILPSVDLNHLMFYAQNQVTNLLRFYQRPWLITTHFRMHSNLFTHYTSITWVTIPLQMLFHREAFPLFFQALCKLAQQYLKKPFPPASELPSEDGKEYK